MDSKYKSFWKWFFEAKISGFSIPGFLVIMSVFGYVKIADGTTIQKLGAVAITVVGAIIFCYLIFLYKKMRSKAGD